MFHIEKKQDRADGAHALGWASIGIGLAELIAPQQVQSILGLEDRPNHRGILRVLGVRELMHGIGILDPERSNRHHTAGVWARVAGDVLDSVLLGMAATKTKRSASFTVTAAAVTAIAFADLYCALKVK